MNGTRFIRRCLCLLVAICLPPGLLCQSQPIPSWWFSSDPKKVLADPQFEKLWITQRADILSQIDPKFAKLSFDRKDSYLWAAETANLPKAPEPKQVFVWSPSDPNSTADLSYLSELTRQIEAAGIRVKCTLTNNGFNYAHFRIENVAADSVTIRPETFVIQVVKPKPYLLYFEYPQRVYWQFTKGLVNFTPNYIPTEPTTVRSGSTGNPIATIESPDQAAKQEIRESYSQTQNFMYKYLQTIIPNSLQETRLAAQAVVEGDVYFEAHSKAREVVVRAFVGDFAFDFPFSLPKR